MNKPLFAKLAAIAAISAMGAFAATANAATSTSSFTVTMTINKACDVTSTGPTGLSFGAQNSTATTVNEGTAGTVTVTCSKGTAYTIGLLGTGNMTSATTGDSVPYTLYSNAGHTAVWGNASPNWVSGTRAKTDPKTKTYNVYGQVPSADYTPGTDYTDTVAVTLTY